MSSVPASPRFDQVPRALVVLAAGAAAVVVIAGVRGAAGIIAPVFLAVVMTIAVHPVHRLVHRRGWPQWTGVALAISLLYSVLVAFSLAVFVSIARFATLLPEYKDAAASRVDDISSRLSDFGIGTEQQQAVSQAFDLGKLADVALNLLSSVASLATDLIFLIVLLLFTAIDAATFRRRIEHAGPRHSDFTEALGGFAHGTRSYLVVSTVFGFIVAVIDTVGLALFGVPAPVLWGLLAFITNYIPNVGFIIGLVPPAILGLLDGGVAEMLWIIAFYCIVNFIIQSVIQPKFVGDAVGLSGAITFVSMVFWTWVLGPLGALLAVPLSLLVRAVLVDADPSAHWLLPILSGNPNDAVETSEST